MASNFDPYRLWLGIATESLPPNHYELLGLGPFESEPPVIAEAFDRQISRLKPFLSGQYAELAQRIVGELAEAKVVLLTPTTRRAYEAELKRCMESATASPPHYGSAAMAAHAAPLALDDSLLPPRAVLPPTPPQPAANAVPLATLLTPPRLPPQHPNQAYTAGPAMAIPLTPGHAATVPIAAEVPFAAEVPATAIPVPIAAGAPRPAAHGSAVELAATLAPVVAERGPPRLAPKDRSWSTPLLVGGAAAALIVASLMYALWPPPPRAVAQKDPPAADQGIKGVPANRERPPADDRRSTNTRSRPPSQRPDLSLPPMPDADDAESPGMAETDPMEDAPGISESAMSEPAMSEPAAPDASMPEPEPPVVPETPDAGPSDPPATVAPETDPREAAAVKRVLAVARAALGKRDVLGAQEQLDVAILETSSPELLAELDRLQWVAQYVDGFWGAVRQGMQALEAAEELEVNGQTVIVVETRADAIVVRASGRNRTYTVEDIPAKLAYVLAERWLAKNDASSTAYLGAFLLVDPKGDRAQARQLVEQAAAAGAAVVALQEELDARDETGS